MTDSPPPAPSGQQAAYKPGFGLSVCPFCHEGDFDLPGLKHHLLAGYCELFDRVIELGEKPGFTP